MNTHEQLKQVAIKALKLSESEFSDELALGENPKWDSLRHMNFIVMIEDEFSIQFESDEIPELKSIALIKSAIQQKRS